MSMAFCEAVQEGSEAAVSRLLNANPTLLETVNILGDGPLVWAVTHEHLGMIRLLVQRGADVNCFGSLFPPLYLAAAKGHEEMLAFLLEEGAHANVASFQGTTPLIAASLGGHVGVVRMLLQHIGGQGLETRGYMGLNALHHAARGGYEEVVKLLLLAGAELTIMDNYGKTPRALAEERRNEANDEETQKPWAGCVAVFEWWEGELKRRPLLERVRCLHDASTTQRDSLTAPVPAFLRARAAAGQAFPQVEVVGGQQEEEQAGASGKREASSEAGRTQEEEERHAVCGYVMVQLNEELFRELLQGFPPPRIV